MGRGKSKATKERLLEEDIKKVKYMLFNNQKDKEFRIYPGKKEGDTEKNINSNPDEFSQEDIIRTILRKKDTLVVLPTGGGKSHCFQGPSFCFKGITLVITPLVALMQDQVKNFNNTYKELYHRYKNNEEGIVGSEYYHGELYRAIYPGMNNLGLDELFDEIAHPHEWDDWDMEHKVQYRLLYVSPERLSSPKFVRELRKREENGEIQIDFVVVDEAHCMSQWGFDFRESYLSIGKFVEKLKKRPVIAAFSATITRQDRQQISTLLGFSKNVPCYLSYMKRSNLHLEAIAPNMVNDKKNWRIYNLIKILRDSKEKGKLCIVYCTSIRNVESLHNLFMRGKFAKYQLLPAKYHGQMSDSQKRKNLDRFLFRKGYTVKGGRKLPPTNIMIATKAFGMGINRDNIEVIVHFDIPRCIEDYYQEIGRAGRDKNIEAKCYLIYSSYSMKEMIRQVLTEAESTDMDKQAITSQFSERMRKHIRFYSFYRMVRMWKYCENILSQRERTDDTKNPQNYIANYFDEEKIDESNVQLLKQFYEYLKSNFYPVKKNGESSSLRLLIQKSFDFDEEYIELLNNSDYQKEIKKELIQIAGRVNELHINNTRIANYLRWCGDQYEIVDEQNRPNTNIITIKEWKRKEKYVTDNRTALMRTDIREDAAFIRMKYPQIEVTKYISPMWKRYCNDNSCSAKVMFVVNQSDNKVERILRESEDKWTDISEDDLLMNLNKKEVTGVFPKESYLDWYAGKDKFAFMTGERERDVSFTLRVAPAVDINENSYNEYKLTYFDLCVADAIYSIEVNGNNYIYLKTIWDVLSGNVKTAFSRSDSKIKLAIEKSIDKMQRLRITIEDEAFPEGIHDEVFMPIKRRDGDGERGYYYEKIPPLYRYAEAINGEFITVPVSLMDGSKISMIQDKKGTVKKSEEFNKEVKEKKTRIFSGSVENIVLFHYLLHRIAISRGKGRGNYIQFDTIHKMIRPYLPHSMRDDMKNLKEKVVSILSFYNRIHYVSFGGYVKDFCIEYECDVDKRSSKGIIIFQFTDNDKENRLFEIKSPWGRKRSSEFFGYIISKDTERVIQENENNYEAYDGIVIFRNAKMIRTMYDKMDRRLMRGLTINLNEAELIEWLNTQKIEYNKTHQILENKSEWN